MLFVFGAGVVGDYGGSRRGGHFDVVALVGDVGGVAGVAGFAGWGAGGVGHGFERVVGGVAGYLDVGGCEDALVVVGGVGECS